MRFNKAERDLLQDLVEIEYRNDTTQLKEYQKILATIYGKLQLLKLEEETE
jgi:hypothetical protein